MTAEALWYEGGPAGSWRVAVSEIAVVGEYTNENGPWLDDYFLVFVRWDRTCFEAPFYASGRDLALNDLGVALGGAELRPELCDSPTWKTQVLWPSELANSPLWELERKAPTGLWSRVLDLVGLHTQTAVLSPEIEEFLSRSNRC